MGLYVSRDAVVKNALTIWTSEPKFNGREWHGGKVHSIIKKSVFERIYGYLPELSTLQNFTGTIPAPVKQ